ncbi:MAG: helix-turn-helix transcriptional regulator [Turicibacter sp.]|nr:helix-turn-helix transcriptional regulator [Turicibacter sp.]
MTKLINKRMTMLRLREGFTQELLAKKIGLSRSHIANFERGGYNPSPVAIQDYCRFFQVSVDYFEGSHLSSNVENQLEVVMRNLLYEEFPECEQTLSNFPDFLVNTSQEYAFYLLKSAYHYAKREAEEAQKIEGSHLNLIEAKPHFFQHTILIKKSLLIYQAEKNYYESNFNKSIVQWDAFSLITVENDEKNRAKLRSIACHFRNQDYVKVYGLTKQVITDLGNSEIKNPTLLAKAYAIQSAAYGQLQMFSEGLAILDKLERLIDEHRIDHEKIVLYINRGIAYSVSNQLSNALINYQKALDHANTPERYLTALISNINCLIKLRQYNIANDYVAEMQSLDLNKREKMIALSYKAELLLYEGKEKESWKLQKPALDYFLENNLTHNASYIYTQLANYYLEKKAYKKAAVYLERKEEIQRAKNKALPSPNA